MNVIVSNKQKDLLDNANIDAIKDLNGLFNVEDLINNFKNYFFTKMIIDATSIVDFSNPEVLKKLVDGIGAEKLIIFLPPKPEPPKKFLDLLVELGIYNFSSNIEDIVRFLQTPNTYNDIKNLMAVSSDMDNSNSYLGLNNNVNVFNRENQNQNDMGPSNFNSQNLAFMANNNISDNINNDANTISDFNTNFNNMSNNLGGYVSNFNQNYDSMAAMLDNLNITNVNANAGNFKRVVSNYNVGDKFILGIRNVTWHAGTTSLIYMLKLVLTYKFNKSVLGIEINTNDLGYFHDKDLISVNANSLQNAISSSNKDVILIDLNNNNCDDLCNDVLYLVEPSILMLNRLMSINSNAFANLKGKKVVLNKSLLTDNDINIFASEAGMPFFFVIPPINDRVGDHSLEQLIIKLGINASNNNIGNGNSHSFLGIFNKNS